MNDSVFDFFLIVLLILMYSVSVNWIKNRNAQLVYALLAIGLTVLIGVQYLDVSAESFGFTNGLSGVVYGTVASLLLGGIIAVSSRIPWTKNFFTDARVLGDSARKAARKILVDIPFVTVAVEEILFRGLLLGWLLSVMDTLPAMLASSVLFGLWHILPSVAFAQARTAKKSVVVGSIAGTVLFTTIAGMLFAWLRVESGSIIAPVIVHFVVNSTSYFASWSANKMT